MNENNIKEKRLRKTAQSFLMKCGNYLLSRLVAKQVPSAPRGLTSVFGMGTGGSLAIWSPQWYCEL